MRKPHVAAALLAGLVGAVVLDVTTMVIWPRGLVDGDLVAVLGSLLTRHADSVRAYGWMLHVLFGLLFAWIYAHFWARGAARPTAGWGATYGFVHALVALIVLPLVVAVHPRSPVLFGPLEAAGLLAGHVAYGAVVGATYRALIGGTRRRVLKDRAARASLFPTTGPRPGRGTDRRGVRGGRSPSR